MTHILHINDHNLCLQSAHGMAISQGYAWLRGDTVLLDVNQQQAPVDHCRLAPQEINSRYWQQCEQSAIPANASGMRHAADLIWTHLGALKEAHDIEDIALVVPSHYQAGNLELLLGIAQSCGLNVTALMNKSVLALCNKTKDIGLYSHIDVQLHQTVISSVEVQAGSLALRDIDLLQGVGIQAMQDSLLKLMQAQFIQNDRFDPLHHADTEQQLFNQLSEIAGQLASAGKANVSIQHEGQLHSTNIDQKSWSQCLNEVLQPILQSSMLNDPQNKHAVVDFNHVFGDQSSSILNTNGLTHIDDVVDMPFIVSLLENSTADAHAYLTELAREPITSKIENARSVNTAPVNAAPSRDSASVAPVAPDVNAATHLLQAGVAIPIRHAEIAIEQQQLVLQSSAQGNVNSLLVNGRLQILNDETRQALRPNDRLGSNLGDGVITVIRVV